jgi:hypothetical protein
MTRKLIVIFFLLGLSVLGILNPGLAQEKRDTDLIARLQGEGWIIVNEGVLRRELRPQEIELFVFGAQGFTWKLQDLRLQYQRLQTAYRATPSAELKLAIANHRKEIASTMQMIQRARVGDKLGLTDDLKESCTINFGYDASASYKTAIQGVWAEAKANFNANCAGFAGEVYAYAYAQTTVNGGPFTKTVTDGPRTGANVTAYAYADANGGGPCESYAYASMTSNNLNPSSYSKAAQNLSCPPPPPIVTISIGPTVINLQSVICYTATWGSTVTGGSGSVAYSWTIDGPQYGTSATFSKRVCRGEFPAGGFTLQVKATDNVSPFAFDTDARWVSVYEPDPCSDPCICASPAKVAQVPICY